MTNVITLSLVLQPHTDIATRTKFITKKCRLGAGFIFPEIIHFAN